MGSTTVLPGLHRRVKLSVAIVVVFLALVLFGTLGARYYQTMTPGGGVDGIPKSAATRAHLSNRYLDTFKEPFELCLFQFVDGTQLIITTQNVDGIAVPPSEVIGILEELGGVSNLLLTVHNHPYPSGFSLPDNAFYAELKAHGFRGVFGIYCDLSQTLIIKTDLGWGKK